MVPRPITPSVLQASSRPLNFFFSHLPDFIDAVARGIHRASDIIKLMVCSAVVTELPVGVFITAMPRLLAAGMSMLSTPMPARPTTRSSSAASITRAVTLEPERISRPCAPLIAWASCSSSRPGW